MNEAAPPVPHIDPRDALKSEGSNRFKEGYAKIEGKIGILQVAETLLKRPAGIVYELQKGRHASVMGWQLALMVFCLLVYGFTVGMFAWGNQLWIAPVKITVGMMFSGLICLPSLFIFLCLSGAEVSLRETTGLLIGMLSITALLLLGFGPVSFVFSRSTESVAFMGFLQYAFWGIAMMYGIQFLQRAFQFINKQRKGHLSMWIVIFLLVALQMTTTLRPIIGTSETYFETEKKFFVTYWLETFADSVD